MIDEQRLDWLSKNYSLIMNIGDTWYVRPGYQKPWIKKKSLREAIDEGMNNERKSQTLLQKL
jgi:hypothetical protein